MATQPTPPSPENLTEELPERRLTYDEGWELIFSLFGSAGEMYASVGGAEPFHRAERAAWGDDEDDPT